MIIIPLIPSRSDPVRAMPAGTSFKVMSSGPLGIEGNVGTSIFFTLSGSLRASRIVIRRHAVMASARTDDLGVALQNTDLAQVHGAPIYVPVQPGHESVLVVGVESDEDPIVQRVHDALRSAVLVPMRQG